MEDLGKLQLFDKLRLTFLGASALLLFGCGGGSNDNPPPPSPPPPPPPPITEVTISGTVQKGLFTRLEVTAAVVDETTGAIGAAVDATITDQTFSVAVDSNSLILLQATGEFLHDLTGETVYLDLPLQVLLDVSTSNTSANINLATHLVASRSLAQLVAAPQDGTPLLAENRSFVSEALGFGASAVPQNLTFDNIDENSDINDPNLQLLLLSAALSNALESEGLFAGGFGTLVDAFVDAESVADVAIVLDQFTGINAQAIYDAVRTNGFTTGSTAKASGSVSKGMSSGVQSSGQSSGSIPSLPPLELPTIIYTCTSDGTCAWVVVEDARIYIGGKALYESSGITRVPVRLSEPAVDPVEVRVFTSDQTAEKHLDYVPIDRTITFLPGETEHWVNVNIIIDAVVEPRERLQVSIETMTLGYLVSTSSATVLIQDGGPSGLVNQDATDLVILEACVKSIRVAGGLSQPGCGTLPGPSKPVLLDPSSQAEVQVDLAATCSSSTDCGPLTRNWLVNFFLVSSSGAEKYLGPYTYTRDSVQLQSASAKPRNLWVSFGTRDIAEFLRNASDEGESVRFEARVDSPQSLIAGVPLPELIPVPGSIVAGDLTIPLQNITDIVPGDGTTCAIGEYELTADFVVGEDLNEEGVDSPATGSACVTVEPGSDGALVATFVSGEVSAVGTFINLAPGHVTRGQAFPAPLGDIPWAVLPYFIVSSDTNPDGTPNDARARLHLEGMPFMFRISGGSITANGIQFEYDGIDYVMDVGYSSQDPRANGQLHSNDIFYSGLKNQSGVLKLNPDNSISATINIAAGENYTAFPKGRVQWSAFTQEIENGVLVSNGSMDLTFAMDQSSSCRGPDCAAGNDLSYEVVTSGTVIDPQGFSLGGATLQNLLTEGPAWGSDATGNNAFTRPDDLLAPDTMLQLALPGYRFPDTSGGRVTDFLLAHLSAGTGNAGLTVHPLGSESSNDGNFYPTGLTVGPETYRDTQGLPQIGGGQDLTGNALGINNGTNVANLPSSIGTKYVVRNGGITGVFNVDPNGLQSPLEFYGYFLELDRFAIRLIDNTLDEYNWIDGALAINGDAGGSGGLELFFSNLEMDCSARFEAANLLRESCDATDNNGNGVVDENCAHRLSAWRADTDIFSMGFDNAASCSTGNQLLTLEQQVQFEALNGPVGLTAKWDSAGTLDSYVSSVQDSYRLDESSETGFAVRPGSLNFEIQDVIGEDDGRYGYAELPDVTVGVPFWNAIKSDVRVANTFSIGIPKAEPTVMSAVGELVGPNRIHDPAINNEDLQRSIIEDDNLKIDARYEWGTSGFGFQLPVYYSPEIFNGERSQFVGRRKEIDLFVLEAGAGINFIDPERTKLSFGASADIAKLKSINLQLDLGDPDNLRKVDNLLVSLKIIKQPVLEPALQDLLDNLSIVNRLANKGLDEVMQKGLEVAIKELGEAAAPVSPFGEDPFVTASKALSQVKSYPQQVFAVIDDEVKGVVDRALQDQRANLSLKLAELEAEIAMLDAGVEVPLAVKNSVDESIHLIQSIHDSAQAADSTIFRSADDVRRLIERAQDPIQRAESALVSIDQIMLQAVTFSKSACDDGNLAGAEASGYLDQIVLRIDSVQKVFDFVNNDDILLPLTELLNNDPELRERIEQTRRDIQTQTEELAGYLDDADRAIRRVACNERYTELLRDARALIADIQLEISQVSGLLDIAKSKINITNEIRDLLELQVLPPLSDLLVELNNLRDELDSTPAIDGPALLAQIDSSLASATSGKVNALLADPANANEQDILGLVFDTAQDEIDNAYQRLVSSLEDEVSDKLAGAYFTPEQLRRMFVSIIMDSQPVADLRSVMNTYLSEINYRVNNLVLLLTDQINTGIRAALKGVESEINDALDAAAAPIRNIPLESAKLDGFAIIAGNELERAHVGAEWTMSPSAEGQQGNTFGAALDAVSWSASNKAAGCSIAADDGRLDVTISAMGIPAKFVGSDIVLRKIYLGFTLGSGNGRLEPRGVFGGISSQGEIGFSEAIIYDPAFAAGIGDIETYIGASAGAKFSDIQAEVAFLVGRTCNIDILAELDPRIAEFITLPASGFKGAYMRGGASIPLLTFGCPLSVGLGADFGAWVLGGPPTTFGGLVGGGAYGKVACIGALRGQILAIGQVNTDGELFFAGEGFGAAGVGWCDPATWTSVPRVKDDDFCGTGHAIFNATFDRGKWKIPKPKIEAIH